MPKVTPQTPMQKKITKSQIQTSKFDNIPSAWTDETGIKMLLYGRSGTGKTTLWATFPKPIMALVISGGNKPGELRSIDTPEYRKTIDPRIISDTDQIREVLDNAEGKYGTVVMDHVSGLQDLVLKELLGVDKVPEQKGWQFASQQIWGQCTMQCKEIIRQLLNFSGHTVLVAHERSFENEDHDETLMPSVGAALTPSLTNWLNGAVDNIGQTYIRQKVVEKTSTVGKKMITTKSKGKGVEYLLRTGPHPVFMTKFRLPKGKAKPDFLVDPSYEDIRALIED